MTAPDRIAELLAPSQPDWLRDGVRDWLATGDPLHLCLCLSRAESARALRDSHLCQAWLALDGEAGWPRARRLADEIRAFDTRAWPRYRDLDAPLPKWSELRRALWSAFRAAGDIGVPQSPEMMAIIIKSAGFYILPATPYIQD